MTLPGFSRISRKLSHFLKSESLQDYFSGAKSFQNDWKTSEMNRSRLVLALDTQIYLQTRSEREDRVGESPVDYIVHSSSKG